MQVLKLQAALAPLGGLVDEPQRGKRILRIGGAGGQVGAVAKRSRGLVTGVTRPIPAVEAVAGNAGDAVEARGPVPTGVLVGDAVVGAAAVVADRLRAPGQVGLEVESAVAMGEAPAFMAYVDPNARGAAEVGVAGLQVQVDGVSGVRPGQCAVHRFRAAVLEKAATKIVGDDQPVGGQGRDGRAPARRRPPLEANGADIAVGQFEADHARAVEHAGPAKASLQHKVFATANPLGAGARVGHAGKEKALLFAEQRGRGGIEYAQTVVAAPTAVQEKAALPEGGRAADVRLAALAPVRLQHRGVQGQGAMRLGLAKSAEAKAKLVEAVVAPFGATGNEFGLEGAWQPGRIEACLGVLEQGRQVVRRNDVVGPGLALGFGYLQQRPGVGRQGSKGQRDAG